MEYDVIVVGAGSAGMLAAATAAQYGRQVLLLEHKGRPGRKLGITGKGRCNLTNQTGIDQIVAAFPRGGRFLFSALSRFTPQDVMNLFEGLGVPLKTERGDRVPPKRQSQGRGGCPGKLPQGQRGETALRRPRP